MLPILQNMGVYALLTFVIDLLPLALAVAYAYRPSEQRLMLMRPLSLAALFGALSCTTSSIALGLRRLAIDQDQLTAMHGRVAMGFAEALAPTFVGLACLAVAWLLIAVRMGSGHPNEGA